MCRAQHLRLRYWIACVAVLTLLFIRPLFELMTYAAASDLYSHILLVPLVTGYLIWSRPPPAASGAAVPGAALCAAAGLAALGVRLGWSGSVGLNDSHATMTLAFVSFVAASGFVFLGSGGMAAIAFPVAFLVFMVPLPDIVVRGMETASALASAETAALYFAITGTPVVRAGTVFELPGIVLEVGQECSGIHSSWVLFITSVLASHLFLTTRWRRIILVAFVVPLGILRNGIRILTIGLLCVHVGPHMVDSMIHHRGGPFFFALSLIPLFLLLWWLRRQEAAGHAAR